MGRKSHILIFGVLLGITFFLLEALNYKTLIREITLELYGGAVGLLFLILGIWLGKSMLTKKRSDNRRQAPPTSQLSDREFEVLQLMSEGSSNQEIADQLFLSLNTVKTHISNIFSKLDVQRRTQAIQRARELEII